jgi:hypothetical protein
MKRETHIILCVIGVLLISGCTGTDNAFIDEYNSKLEVANQILEQHDTLIEDINANLNNLSLYQQKIQEYVEWVDGSIEELGEFQLYVETNHQRLRNMGVNPDYVRDNVISSINVMRDNKIRFLQQSSLVDAS